MEEVDNLKRYHHATNMYLRFKELNDIGVEYEPKF